MIDQQNTIVICFSTLLSLETILAMLEQPLEMGGGSYSPLPLCISTTVDPVSINSYIL